MRSIITSILVLISVCAYSQTITFVGNQNGMGNASFGSTPPLGGGGGGCATVAFTNSAVVGDFGNSSTAYYIGQFQVTFVSPQSVCSVTFSNTLDNGVSFRASIWTMGAANALGTQQGSYSANVTGTGIAKSVTFSFSPNVSLSASTQYAFVLSRTDGTILSTSTGIWRTSDVTGSFFGAWDNALNNVSFSSLDSIMGINTP